eukprot:3724284-Amphidinium_carterae.3
MAARPRSHYAADSATAATITLRRADNLVHERLTWPYCGSAVRLAPNCATLRLSKTVPYSDCCSYAVVKSRQVKHHRHICHTHELRVNGWQIIYLASR